MNPDQMASSEAIRFTVFNKKKDINPCSAGQDGLRWVNAVYEHTMTMTSSKQRIFDHLV